MTPESQRIAIHKACGWSRKALLRSENADASEYWTRKGEGIYQIPDYPNDLNAMHEAEKVLNPVEVFDYWMKLTSIVDRDKSQPWQGLEAPLILHATASQRAEAFLRTINLWAE